MKLKPHRSGWRPWPLGVFLAVLSALWLSGVLLDVWTADGDSGWGQAALTWRHRSAMLHAGLAWCLAVWAGRHVLPHISRCKDRTMTWRHRITGWAMAVGLWVLMLTAWALMYGSADEHAWIGLWHLGLGAVLPVLMGLHWIGPRFKHRRHRRFANGSIKNPSASPPAGE